MVGSNPDIIVEKGKIVLKGVGGGFTGKTIKETLIYLKNCASWPCKLFVFNVPIWEIGINHRFPRDFHGNILSNGDYVDAAGNILDNIGNYLR